MLNREAVTVAGGVVVVSGAAVAGAVQTKETGPILAFVGAIIVVLITAWTTDRRQARALEDGRDRLEARLAHERRQADVADLRSVLEEALAAADRARNAIVNVWQTDQGQDEAYGALAEFETYVDRLKIRLGADDPVVTTIMDMGNTMHAMRRMGAPVPPPIPPQVLVQVPSLLAWGQAYHRYVALAQALVGSQVESQEPRGELAEE